MPVDLDDWLDHLESLHPRGESGVELGLERVRLVSRALGQSQHCPVITVSGTNGKGSTCAFLEKILLAAGYRVGLYTSPHLLRYSERVRIDGLPASDAALSAAFAKVEAARGDIALTYFEFGTLAAWEVFSVASLDAIILEVGLGGRLDATNVYDADCAILTTIDLDHMDYLGATRDAIGREKAGIGRPGRPFICGDAAPPESVLDECRRVSAEFLGMGAAFGFQMQEGQWQYWGWGGRKLGGLAFPSLRGNSQLHNASCAIAALDCLRGPLPVTAQDIRRGLAEVHVAGRCQVLPGRPQIVLDVAHNPQAIEAMIQSIGGMGFARTTWAVFGMMADKDIASVVQLMSPCVDHWLTCGLPSVRAASASQLSHALARLGSGATAQEFDTPEEALRHAQENAECDDRILVFGSFLTVAGVMRHLKRDD